MIRVAVLQRMPGGEQAVNVLNFSGTTSTDFAAIQSKVEAFYNIHKTNCVDSWQVDRIDMGIYVVGGSAPTSFSVFPAPLIQGTATGDPLPNYVALCISLRAGNGFARSDRGRIYMGGFAESVSTAVSAGAEAGPTLTKINQYAGETATLAAGPNELCVKKAGSIVSFPVADGYVDQRWDLQRRRQEDLPRAQRTVFTV